jgi:ubiquinone/menaquinone biosynthesis C-methylase UbiE
MRATPTDRLSSEQEFHDRQAQDRAATFQRQPNSLHVDADRYLDHETWIRPAFDALGDLGGLDVLDYGCGHGIAAVVLAQRGARVTAFDLSAGYLREAQPRAQANGVVVRFVQADGERLPFANSSFDRVWGNAVLHHLNIPVAGREIHRVLRPGGIAVFCEPWGENPLLNLARRWLPYPGKQRTPDEQPLRRPQIEQLRQVFPVTDVQGHQLLGMTRRILPAGRLTATLQRCDTQLLRHLPVLERWCRYVVLTLKK